jgi:hypothetical protein
MGIIRGQEQRAITNCLTKWRSNRKGVQLNWILGLRHRFSYRFLVFASSSSPSRLFVIDTTLCQYPAHKYPLFSAIMMDVYSTSFTYPRKSRHIRSPASSLDYQPPDLRPSVSDPFASPTHHHHHLPQSDVALPADADAIQKISMMAMSLHGCHVSYLLADHARAWNFYVSGAYQQVMATRGMILKECPIQVCLSSQSVRNRSHAVASRRYQSCTLRDP